MDMATKHELKVILPKGVMRIEKQATRQELVAKAAEILGKEYLIIHARNGTYLAVKKQSL